MTYYGQEQDECNDCECVCREFEVKHLLLGLGNFCSVGVLCYLWWRSDGFYFVFVIC